MSAEADIVINGTKLTPAQSMTVRVAIESFAMDLVNTEDKGPTEKAYTERIKEIRRSLYKYLNPEGP